MPTFQDVLDKYELFFQSKFDFTKELEPKVFMGDQGQALFKRVKQLLTWDQGQFDKKLVFHLLIKFYILFFKLLFIFEKYTLF